MIKQNIELVKENIIKACERSNRDPAEVTLIAVSKTKPEEVLMEAYDYGIRTFGENYVQELVGKIEHLPTDIEWHMIGHLQRNKVKYIIDRVSLIHSVDSMRLAEEISKEAVKRDIIADILVEVNVGEQDTKFGITPQNCEELVLAINALPNVNVKGLMTSAPYVENGEENREYFRQMKQLCVDINAKNADNIHMNVLSMGMTNDYIVAVEEGATLVRVGTAIFGSR